MHTLVCVLIAQKSKSGMRLVVEQPTVVQAEAVNRIIKSDLAASKLQTISQGLSHRRKDKHMLLNKKNRESNSAWSA